MVMTGHFDASKEAVRRAFPPSTAKAFASSQHAAAESKEATSAQQD
jgi:hypothetical protein